MVMTGAGDGWACKKRKERDPVHVPDGPIGFMFENPLYGAFAKMKFTKDLIEQHQGRVFKFETSYCKYGRERPMKATGYVGTLKRFKPEVPCRAIPCREFKINKRHAYQVKLQSAADKNSIPPKLVDMEVEAWLADYPDPAQRFLFIDVFAGYGSVCQRVRNKFPRVKVYANDIVKRTNNDVELDIAKFPMDFLFKLALQKHFGDSVFPDMSDGFIPWLRAEKISVLFHLSTPCNTYSVDGLAANRDKTTLVPRSALACAHDEMNSNIMEWLKRMCF